MDLTTVVSLIGSLGFPIVAYFMILQQLESDRTMNREQREADRLEHKEEMTKITDAVKNNTLVMQKLVDTLTYTDTEGKHS